MLNPNSTTADLFPKSEDEIICNNKTTRAKKQEGSKKIFNFSSSIGWCGVALYTFVALMYCILFRFAWVFFSTYLLCHFKHAISSRFPPATKHAWGLQSIASVLPTSDVRHETHGFRKDRARLLERVFLFKFFNDNWVSIGLYDNLLALNDLKQEIMGIKDKTDTRYVRVRAPSQLIFVAQAAEFNRTPGNRTL